MPERATAREAPALRVRQVPGAPVVVVRVALAGGARRESVAGLALVTGRSLDEGTRRRDYRQLAAAAEALGMNACGYGAFEQIGITVDALAADWRAAIDLAAEMTFEPAFPEERLAFVARQAAAELEAQADDAEMATARAFADLLYAPHPKGRPLQGDAASLARLTGEQCAAFHAASLARGGVVVVAGDFDEEPVRSHLAAAFAALTPVDPASRTGEPVPLPAPRRREIRTRARDQAHLFVGQLTVGRGDPDCAALELAAVALGAGSGLSGRIPQRVRDREGLAYHATADLVAGAGLDAGRLVAYAGTSPATLARAERAVTEELERLRTDGFSSGELAEARAYLLGREPFRRETARQWADLAALGAIEGLPIEDPEWSRARIAAVEDAAVAAALARHLDPARLTVTVGLPAA